MRWAVLACCVLTVLSVLPGGSALVHATGAAAAPPQGTAPHITGVREADAACARCHAAIFARYVDSPMAKGSGLASDRQLPGSLDHAASGMNYRVDVQAGQPILVYSRRGPADAAIAGNHPLAYFLGSGRLGTTYLYADKGYLLESPVAWYARLKGYAMAPGLEDVKGMPAALPMEPGCMRCHMSDVQPADPGSRDHFAGLPFLHGGITCEACHGDTAAHVRSHGRTPVAKLMELDPVARDSVCASCHLEGDVSVVQPGRDLLRFHPGDHLDEFVEHFVIEQGSTRRSVSETEQLLASRCKRTSGDRMSCMSCHDPHGDPAPAERVAFYRAKCLACHSDASFARTHFPASPDCTGCHMPKNGAADTPHVAWTDHRLLQRPETNAPAPDLASAASSMSTEPAPAPAQGSPGSGLTLHGLGSDDRAAPAAATPPEQLHAVLPSEHPSPRDFALAYYKATGRGHPELLQAAWSRLNAVALADRATSQPDPEILVALGYLNSVGGRLVQARSLLEESLRLQPDNLDARSDEAALLARLGELQPALSAAQAAFAHNEDSETLGVNLALLQCALGEPEPAHATLLTVLRFSPDSTRARETLRRCGADTPAH